MSFKATDVAELRNRTGAGMMDCKKALTHTNGDMEKAAEYLREQGVNIAAKKASRIASEGVVYTDVSADGKTGAMVEINCESDFVSASATFVELCKQVCGAIISSDAQTVEELLTVKCSEGTVLDLVNNATAKIGEKISVRRFVKFATKSGLIDGYIHMGGKVGVIVEASAFKAGSEETLHDVALQIAAAKPSYVTEAEVPAEVIEKEKKIMLVQMQGDPKNANKPQEILEKIVAGKLGKFYQDNCLLDQPFVKDDSQKVSQVIGSKFAVARFARFEMGEGIEKKSENLQDEVAKQVAAMKKN